MLIFMQLQSVLSGNAIESGDAGRISQQSFLFCLTQVPPLKSDYREIEGIPWQSEYLSYSSGAIRTIREKSEKCSHRLQAVLITASGLQG